MMLCTNINNLFLLSLKDFFRGSSYSNFFFFNYINQRLIKKQILFFQYIFQNKFLFFILSTNLYFLQYYNLPLLYFIMKLKKTFIHNWLFLYNLITFKTTLWIQYLYFFLKKNNICILVTCLGKKYYNWLKYFRLKNFIIVGAVEKQANEPLLDFEFFLSNELNYFYLFFVLNLFFKNFKYKVYHYYYYFKKFLNLVLHKKLNLIVLK